MSKTVEKYVVYGLRETYHELGEYQFKIVLNPRHFKSGRVSSFEMVDSDGRSMKFEVSKWGRKIGCKFIVDPSVSDGVSVVKLALRDDEGSESLDVRLSFWVIKP